LENRAAQILTRAAEEGTPFVAGQSPGQVQAADDSYERAGLSSEEETGSSEPATDNPLSDSDVQRGMREAWTDFQASDPINRHEEGGYIVRESDGTYGVERWPRGQGANITVPPRDGNGRYNGKDVVGNFHTHPNPPVDERGRTWT